MSAYVEYIKAMGRAEILNNLIIKERNKEITREFILSLGFTEEEYRNAPCTSVGSKNDNPSDLDYVTKFANDLSTIIYTHNGMDYELYQVMNALKNSADEMRRMLYEEFGLSQKRAVLGKMNIYYYPETIKILRTYFDNYESIKGDAEKKQSILNSCKSIQAMILQKKQELFDAIHPMDFDLDFLRSQLSQDLREFLK